MEKGKKSAMLDFLACDWWRRKGWEGVRNAFWVSCDNLKCSRAMSQIR